MLGRNILRHINEFRRYLRNFKYEVTDEGIYFAKAGALVRGTYEHWVAGSESELVQDHNLITNEGLSHFLDVALVAGTALDPWYIALHSGTGNPTADTTAFNYNSTLNEITSPTEGYSEAARQQWQGDAVDTVNTEVVNDTTPAVFTIATASSLAVNGAALLSESPKGSTSGVLVSAVKFATTRNLSNGDEFNVKYKVDADAV